MFPRKMNYFYNYYKHKLIFIFAFSTFASVLLYVFLFATLKQCKTDQNWINSNSHRTSLPPSSLDHSILHNPTRLVVLVTEGKSGSTPLGEIFNQNPDIFYLFEPLHSLEFIGTHKEVLLRIYNCDFDTPFLTRVYWGYAISKNRFYTSLLSSLDSSAIDTNTTTLNTNTLNTTTLNSTTLNSTTMNTTTSSSLYETERKKVILERVTAECKRAKMKVVKVIRLRNLDEIANTIEKEGVDWKIVHLIRDPRAILSSRIRKHWIPSDPHTFRQHARLLCKYIQEKMNVSSLFLKGGGEIVMRVKYEDWMDDMEGWNLKLFRYIGLDMIQSEKLQFETRLSIENVLRKDLHRNGKLFDIRKAIDGWKDELSEGLKNITNQECELVLRMNKYL